MGRPLSNFFCVGAITDTLLICVLLKWGPFKHKNSDKFCCTPFSSACHLPCPSLTAATDLGVSLCMSSPTPCYDIPPQAGTSFYILPPGACLAHPGAWGSSTPKNCLFHQLLPFGSVWGGISSFSGGSQQNQPHSAHSSDYLKWRFLLPCAHSLTPLFLLWGMVASQINHWHPNFCLHKEKM